MVSVATIQDDAILSLCVCVFSYCSECLYIAHAHLCVCMCVYVSVLCMSPVCKLDSVKCHYVTIGLNWRCHLCVCALWITCMTSVHL